DDPLFSYVRDGERWILSKSEVMKCLSDIWKRNGSRGPTGHSFRVGGALLLHFHGSSVEAIKKQGRWAGDSYKRYIKTYSEEKKNETIEVLQKLKK
ncbi:hypothetical protein DFH28DRAFT_888288, partial [Melampsora americana]